MNLSRSLLAAALVAAAALPAMPVSTVHAADNLGGDAVPGVCLLSREAVFAQSKVGQAASARLQQIADQVRAQLANERKPLDADIQSYQQKQSSLPEAQRKQQGEALQMRMQALQAQAETMNQRIQLTRGKALQNIGLQAQSAIAASYKSHRCGLLLNRDAVLDGNMSNDLTTEVVQGLDRKITTTTFNLEPLPASNGK
jgi:Skp family chaperone for outer membrane proteins